MWKWNVGSKRFIFFKNYNSVTTINIKMINFDNYVNENKTKLSKNWPYIPDHPYRILIIGDSGFFIEFNRKASRHQ